MAKQSLNNKEFLKIMRDSCKDGKIDDKCFNEKLSNYYPYDLIFKRRE